MCSIPNGRHIMAKWFYNDDGYGYYEEFDNKFFVHIQTAHETINLELKK